MARDEEQLHLWAVEPQETREEAPAPPPKPAKRRARCSWCGAATPGKPGEAVLCATCQAPELFEESTTKNTDAAWDRYLEGRFGRKGLATLRDTFNGLQSEPARCAVCLSTGESLRARTCRFCLAALRLERLTLRPVQQPAPRGTFGIGTKRCSWCLIKPRQAAEAEVRGCPVRACPHCLAKVQRVIRYG